MITARMVFLLACCIIVPLMGVTMVFFPESIWLRRVTFFYGLFGLWALFEVYYETAKIGAGAKGFLVAICVVMSGVSLELYRRTRGSLIFGFAVVVFATVGMVSVMEIAARF